MMSSSLEGSVASVIGAWKSKANARARNLSTVMKERGLIEICRGKNDECRLFYDTEKSDYTPQMECQRGKICTEFRILKYIANKRTSLNSKDPLVQDFYAFKTL